MFFCARTQAQRKSTTHFDFIILHDGHSLFMMPNISGTCPEVREQSTYDVQRQLAEFQRVGADVITEYAHSKLYQQRGSPQLIVLILCSTPVCQFAVSQSRVSVHGRWLMIRLLR